MGSSDFDRDYRDICYFIDHVDDINLRIDVIKSIGYKIGINAVSTDSKEKSVIIGKRGEYRVQITPKIGSLNYAKCAIIA